jgi:hypothetical protein
MRRLRTVLALGMLIIFGYLASPFLTAYRIREAIRSGDTATLTSMVEWPAVRRSLKQSLATEPASGGDGATSSGLKPSLWQRIRMAAATRVTDTLIDHYLTPDRLPAFFAYLQSWRATQRPTLAAPPMALAGTRLEDSKLDHLVGFLRRVKRAAFLSLSRVEIEIADRSSPRRSYVGTLEWQGYGWKLVGIRIASSSL